MRDESEIEETVSKLTTASRRVFAPRLVVLAVASDIWQETVEGLARVCSLVIVDVSEPSDNLLWEIRELTGEVGSRCVFVGERDRVVHLVGAIAPGWSADPLVEELRHLLDGRDVLAYGKDRRERSRFARALRNRLLAASTEG